RGNKWSMWMGYSFLIHAVTILLIIFASGSVANEYSHGTIKFLLVNPVKRWKILLSKYCTIISMGIILTAVVFIICGIIASISDFDNSLKAASLTVKDAQVHRSSAFFVVFKTWALNSLTMLVVVTFTFSVSSFTRKSAAAITLSLVFLLLGATLSSFLSASDSDWGRFLLFSNLDIQNIADGNPLFYGQTVGFAVFVIIEHMAVFLITAFDAFNKKDI
ncbi:MAG: ABC transporter permease subunit, partial [Ruminococcus sp.]|nr:ABC transporter permease subunit [Ruminococcus sp.]